MGKKKKPTVLKKSVSESTSLAADTANLSSASPTPGPPTPTPESHPSTSAPIEPPQPEPVTNSGGVETNGTDQPQDLKTHADALKEQGNDFFKNKHYEKAVGLYTEAIKIYPTEPAYYTNRAAASIALQKFRDALKDCQQAQTMQSDAPQTKTLLRLARCQIATGAPTPALSTLRIVQSLEKTGNQNPELWRLKGKAEEMHQHLETVSQARTQKQWAKASLALDAALKLCEGKKDDVPTEWRSWAVSFKIARREYDSALEAIREATRYQPNSPELMALRGQVYFLMNRTPEATMPLQNALRLDPENSQARNMLKRVREFEKIKAEGNRLFSSQKTEEAIAKYTEALDVVGRREEEGGGGVVRAILLSNRATAKMRFGKSRYGDALADVEESLALHPDNWKAIRTRAKIRLAKDEYEAAIADFRSALEIVEREDGLEKTEHELAEEIKKAEVLLKRSKEKDYYKILEIERTATDLEIKKAYRKQSLIHHPDKGGDEEKFKLAAEAFQVLSDSEKRRRYDSGEDVDGQMNSGDPFGGMGGFPPGMMEQMLFAQMFSQRGGFGGGGARPGGGGGRRGGHSHSHSYSSGGGYHDHYADF